MNMESNQQTLPPGYQLKEFVIERKLGEGGFGVTYLAQDTNLQKSVAIKEYLPGMFAVRAEGQTVLPKSDGDKEDFEWGLTSFIDEARVLAKFEHPNVNRVLRFFDANNTAYIVLEYISGRPLTDQLKDGVGLDEATILRMLDQLTAGLDAVHDAGVIHRDIKPDNIMIRDNGDAVLLDFGAARQTIGAKTRDITTILTPGYAPFEQYSMDSSKIKAYTDIYALGMVMYRCMSGCGDSEIINSNARVSELVSRPPKPDPLPLLADVVNQAYSPALIETIQACIESFQEKRPQTITELRDRLPFAKSSGPGTQVFKPNKASATQTRVLKSDKDRKQDVQGKSGQVNKKVLTIGLAAVVVLGIAGAMIFTSGDDGSGNLSSTKGNKSKDTFLKGLTIPKAVKQKRDGHLRASMGLYVFTRIDFSKCMKTQCPKLGKLRSSLVKFKETKWKKDGYNGTLLIESASKTNIKDCAWRLKIEESIKGAGVNRVQKRIYCTNSGVKFKVAQTD